MIRLERVSKVFGTVTAVDSVDMEVPAGAVCVLLGPSGCGKTTTMKMINRLIPPSSGRIFIDGKDTAGVDEVTLRRSIGYVIQQIGCFRTRPSRTISASSPTCSAVRRRSRASVRPRGQLPRIHPTCVNPVMAARQ